MRTLFTIAVALLVFAGVSACSEEGGGAAAEDSNPMAKQDPQNPQVEKGAAAMSEAEWKKALTPEQYRVLREKGTDLPHTGAYVDTKEPGIYRCAACGAVLFRSETKFDSGCGWPSFFRAANGAAITETRDTSHGFIRTEVTCSSCGGHLGHVFDDGPAPTGLRYCINSTSIKLEPEKSAAPSTEAKKPAK